MPGLLRKDAVCPICCLPILFLTRVVTPKINRCTLTFHHEDHAIHEHRLDGTISDMDVVHDRLYEGTDGPGT